MQVNYKNKKRYNTGKKPIRQPIYLTWLIRVLSFFALLGKKKKIEKINMEGLKPPYMILSNHMSFIDFELTALGTWPHRVNNVVNVDGYIKRAWLMEWIGSVCTRKFTTDLNLVKSISTVLRRGDVLCLYPEARYSPCGITSYLPPSLGKIIKKNKAPVVAVVWVCTAKTPASICMAVRSLEIRRCLLPIWIKTASRHRPAVTILS